MSYFDSTICCPPSSSPATYHSYMCRSKGDYTCHDNERLLKTVDYDQLWSVSQEKYTVHNETHHISKLRNILSETISNITKDSKLQKGESVELTLEIELTKTESHTPSNSMVEVTIIQHDKKGKETENVKLACTNPKQTATTDSYTSESASQKRRNWFQRVISRQNDPNQNMLNKYATDNLSKKAGTSELYLDRKLMCNSNIKSSHKHPKSNFIKVLPEKIPISGDFAKGYRRVSPTKKSPEIPINFQSPRAAKTDKRKKTLVKKISKIILPTKKSNKNKTVKTALTALKNEVESIKLPIGKENNQNIKTKKAPVHSLGKLVGNILDDMMDRNNEIKNNSLPLKYQKIFEPVVKPSTTGTEINPHKKRTTLIETNKFQSHSDTCCVHFKYDSSDLNIKSSNSASDWRAQTDSNDRIKSSERGDSTELTSTKKCKDEDENRKKVYKKHAKGDASTQLDHKDTRKRSHKNNTTIATKKSLIEWNGQTVQVNKEIKTKIEKLIVNELQNLALKEGMECDVIPLHSSESRKDLPVEKMSSFVCELDISDKKQKKPTKSKKLKETKLIRNSQTLSRETKIGQVIPKLKQKDHMQANKDSEVAKALQPSRKDTHIISVGKNIKKPPSTGPGLDFTNGDFEAKKKSDYGNDVKITYVNKNVKNWSNESTSLKLKGSQTPVPTRYGSKAENSESPVFKFGEENNIYQKAISSGFIKKIGSNDSTWKSGWFEATDKVCLEENFSKQFVSVTNTRSTVRFSSATSNECQSSIEIELDIKDLELILKEAKQKQKADKVVVNAKCRRESKKQRHIRFTGKNSPSYTNQLLSNAAEKLEKYVRRKKKQ